MKKVVLSFLIHILLIIVFFIIYYILGESEFVNVATTKATPMTFLNLATSIQAGVGLSTLLPNTEWCQFLTGLQQFIGMGLNVFIYWWVFR